MPAPLIIQKYLYTLELTFKEYKLATMIINLRQELCCIATKAFGLKFALLGKKKTVINQLYSYGIPQV